MKKKIIPMLLAFALMMGMTSMSFASTSIGVLQDQTQDQIQAQILDQTQDQDQLREQDRQRLRDRLCITDSAIQLYQERTRTQAQIRFSDIENNWARNQIRNAWAYRLFDGYPDGTFRPNATISGTECLLVANRLMNCLGGLDPGNITSGAVDWNGVPIWAREQLQEQHAQRLMTETNYYQDALMNRAHVAVMLAKALQIDPIDEPATVQTRFMDQNRIAAADLGYILALQNMGVLIGYPDGTYQPDRSVTRAEFAVMMTRILDILE